MYNIVAKLLNNDKLQKKCQTTKWTNYQCVLKLLRCVTFLVMPEGIQVEKCFSTRGTCQPHPQMLAAHMCADCSTWGWWPLCETLNSVLIHPLDTCQWKAKGYNVGWDSHLWSLGLSWRGGFQCQLCLTASRIGDFRCYLFKLLRGGLETGGWGWMAFFRWGGDGGNGGVRDGSLQEPIGILCLWSCHCQLIFL